MHAVEPTPGSQSSADPSRTETALSATDFASAVTAITSAFGDPTRRDIFLWLREHDGSATAAEVAAHFDLHANVARHHLDKLTGGGYVEVVVAKPTGGGAGRPSKRYSAQSASTEIAFPVRHDDLLVSLLGRALAMLPADEVATMAEDVGVAYGRSLADTMGATDGRSADPNLATTAQRSFRSSLHTVADALSAHGFAAHAEKHGDELRIVAQHCPFGETAIEHPVICAVDRGLVKGMLSSLYGDTDPALEESVARGSETCVTIVTAS